MAIGLLTIVGHHDNSIDFLTDIIIGCMNVLVNILLLLWMPCLLQAGSRSLGSLSFRCNGEFYAADSTHARAYAVKQTSVAYINGANKENMVASIEWKAVKGPGQFVIDKQNGKVEFTINHKTYLLTGAGDYIKIMISKVKQQDSFLLLSGTFEGQLQDKSGNKIKITEGIFETLGL